MYDTTKLASIQTSKRASQPMSLRTNLVDLCPAQAAFRHRLLYVPSGAAQADDTRLRKTEQNRWRVVHPASDPVKYRADSFFLSSARPFQLDFLCGRSDQPGRRVSD